MGDAAQGEPRKHEVFEEPFKVEPKLEVRKTPTNYRRFPGGDELPGEMKVWRVQDTGKTSGGVVSRSWGYEDSPDAEVLAPGFNFGKESGAVGVGRHGNFLQWGFSAPPSQMTDEGRKFFLNCVCYIRKFDGKGLIVRKKTGHRTYAVRDAMLINKIEAFRKSFPPDLVAKYQSDPEGLTKLYKDNFELIYPSRSGRSRVYLIDPELKSLGIDSNRSVSTLERLVALLKDEEHAEMARQLLDRYTEESFATPDEWSAWLDKSRGRIYFSDVGGYKFRVVPEGYLDVAD